MQVGLVTLGECVQVAVLVRLVSGYQVNCSREVKVREVEMAVEV